MNVSIATDNEMAKHWMALAPHNNVFVMNSPRAISNNIEIPKPVISTFSNWLERGFTEVINPEKLARMNMLADA